MSLSYRVYDSTRGKANVEHTKSYVFHSPCETNAICTPYEVTLSPGKYIFEAWGSSGGGSSPGKGAYTKGTIFLYENDFIIEVIFCIIVILWCYYHSDKLYISRYQS